MDELQQLPDGRFRCPWCKLTRPRRFRHNCPNASRGLGDTVAKLTRKLGIKPCGGCKKRQELLNRLVPYKRRQ